MSDFFSEYIIKRQTPAKDKMIGVLCVLGAIVVTFLGLYSMLFIPYVGFLVMIFVYFLVWVYFRNIDVEWEYTLVEKSMMVDKIMHKAKRKKMADYDLTKLELVAPEKANEALAYDHRNLKTIDFSSLKPDNTRYVMIIMHNNELIKVIFEPSERMLKEMRNVAPRKVIMAQ